MGLIILAAILATVRLFWARLTGQPVPAAPDPLPRTYRLSIKPSPSTVPALRAGVPSGGGGAPLDCEVIVVGAGPTGLMAASLLKRSGVNVRIIDKRGAPSLESRAFAMQARSVELFQSMGLHEEVIDRGIVNSGIEFHVRGKRVGGLDFDRSRAPDTPFQYILMIPQADSEEVLLRDLAAQGVEVERGVEVVGAAEDSGAAALRYERNGEVHTMRAHYVIGADGAHSTLRKALGMSFHGAKYEQSFLLADCKVEWPLDHARFRVFMNRDRIGLFLPLRGSEMSRVMATDFGGGRGAGTSLEMKLEELQDAFAQAAQVPVKLGAAAWTTRYRVHHRGVDSYRQGRFFVAGDAVHIHSPAGGQGMNTGLQDAANLAWKLAAVLRRGSPAALLDSYHAERYPVGQDVLRFTDRLFSAAAAQTGWRAVLRDFLVSTVARVALRLPVPHRKAFRKLSEINIAYRESEFVKNEFFKFESGPRAGERAPDAKLSVGRRMFELLAGYQLHVVVFSRRPLRIAEITELVTHLTSLQDVASQLRTHIVARVEARRDPRVEFVDGPEVFDRYGVAGQDAQAVYIVRPDGYIAWRSPGLDLGRCENFLAHLYGVGSNERSGAEQIVAAEAARAMPHP